MHIHAYTVYTVHIPCIYQLSPEVQGRWLDALLARRAARVHLPSGAPLERSYLVQKEHLTLTLTLTLPLHLHLLLPLPLPLPLPLTLTRCRRSTPTTGSSRRSG